MEENKSVTSINSESLEIYYPKNLRVLFAEITSLPQALRAGSSSIAALKRNYPVERITALIKLQLVELNAVLGLKRPLSEDQIDAIADEIVTQYFHLTMADVYLIFRRAKTGYYGEFYESINMPKVLRWFRDYFDERCDEAARQSMDEAARHKYIGDRTSMEALKVEHSMKLETMKAKIRK